MVTEVERLTDLAVELGETVSVGDHPHGVTLRVSDARYATQQVLRAEARILSLAERGRRGGYGRVPMPELTPYAKTLGLDSGQYLAVLKRLFELEGEVALSGRWPGGTGCRRTVPVGVGC